MISIIVAMDDQQLIGKKDSRNGMPRNNPEDLKQWLKEDDGSALFGKIEMSNIVGTPSSTLIKRTAIKFESENIKIELKENYDKALLMNLMEVLINVK